MREIDRKQGVQSESAILVGVELPNSETARDNLDELAGLVETAGAEIVGRLTQKRQVPDQTTYLGKGKVEQLELMIRATDADVVIFDNNLSPAQIRNLESELEVKVLDRTEVILDIFSTRAQTHEARLAVELAQLEYSLPRLKRMWSHLSRIKAGVGMRGPGEKQLETDRRLVEKRISDLRNDLNQVQRRKEREVAARADRMTVSLVGYTNAGKSTLMNKLTGSDVLAEDKLFATLDTRTRRWQLPGWGPVLLSDTVGFIRDLPHSLIASFKATLEEARQADLLLHVADASNPTALEQIKAVYDVLEELGINQKDTLLVLNQVDAVIEDGALERLKERYPSAIAVSAKTGEGLNRLGIAVSEALTHHFLEVDVETDVSNGRLLAALAQHGEVLSRTYAEDRVSIHCRMPQRYLGTIPPAEARIKLRSNGHDFIRGNEEPHNGFAHANGTGHISSNGHANSNGHASQNGASHHGAA
ncbi:MAG TPA: GTPase HflX [Lacipirellulaceae bacterium]|nr:GTPase HflX [Lacipirellulaceae bacterium]